MRRRATGVAAAILVVGLVSLPIAAAAVVGGWDGSQLWYPFSNNGSDPADDSDYLKISGNSTNGLYNETWINSGASKPAWDSSWVVSDPDGGPDLYCEPSTADRLAPSDALGGVALVCAPETWAVGSSSVQVTREFRVFGDGKTVRMRLSVTNPGATAITNTSFNISDNFYCDGWTNVDWSTTGGSNIALWAAGGTDASGHHVTAEDLRYVLDAPGDVFSGGIGCPTTLVARGAEGATVPPVQGSSSFGGDAAGHHATDQNDTIFTIPTLAPGATAELVVLTRYYHFAYTGNEAATKANALVQTTAAIDAGQNEDLTAFAVAGIADPSTVLNWFVPAAPPAPDPPATAPTLSATGVTVSPWFVSAAAGAVILGAALLVVARTGRRRRSTARHR